jgi:uncharacterized protein YkwD
MAQEHPSDFGEISTLRTPRSNRRRILALLSALPLTLALAVGRELDQPLASVADAKKKRKKRKRSAKQRCVGGLSGDYQSLDSEERAFLELINDYRCRQGRSQLAAHTQLAVAAEVYSNDQANNGAKNHIGSDGSTVNSRIQAAGYNASYYGENIYWNEPDGSAKAAFEWWKSSSAHNANMLHKQFTHIGIARVKSRTGNRWFWTTDFGRPW